MFYDRSGGVVEEQSVRYLQHLGGVAVPRIHTQGVRIAHERVSLVHVDVADATTRTRLDIKVDRLHEYTRAHVVQERVLVVRAKEGRIRESVRARGFGERQLGPRSEAALRRVLGVHRRGECRRASLSLVRRRMARHLVLDSKIAGEAPDFLVAILAIKDEIPIFVLAVGLGTNVKLENPLSDPTERRQDWLSHRGETP